MRPPGIQVRFLQEKNVGLRASQELDDLLESQSPIDIPIHNTYGIRWNEDQPRRRKIACFDLLHRNYRLPHLSSVHTWMVSNRETDGPITRKSKQTCGVFTRWFCILREICAIVHLHHLALGPGKSESGVQRDRPNQICSNHAQNERYAHEIKERKDEQCIREKTAPDDELRMSAEIQERIRRPALRVALPDFQ